MYIVAMMEVLFAQFAKNRFEVMIHKHMLDLLPFAHCVQKYPLKVPTQSLLIYCFMRTVRKKGQWLLM
jgi:hypothetical protein